MIFTSEGQISLALRIIESIISEASNDTKQKFRTRVRELPSLLSTLGLIPSIAFLYGMSKAGEKCGEKIAKFNEKVKGGNIKLEDIVKELSAERAGYFFSLASIICYIAELGPTLGIQINSLDPRDVIKKLVTRREIIPIMEKFTIDFTLWLKKLAEGAIPE